MTTWSCVDSALRSLLLSSKVPVSSAHSKPDTLYLRSEREQIFHFKPRLLFAAYSRISTVVISRMSLPISQHLFSNLEWKSKSAACKDVIPYMTQPALKCSGSA